MPTLYRNFGSFRSCYLCFTIVMLFGVVCKVLVGPCCVSVAYVLKIYSNLAAVSTKQLTSVGKTRLLIMSPLFSAVGASVVLRSLAQLLPN